MGWRVGCVLAMVGAVGGCCHCLPPMAVDTRPLPAAISMEEQLQDLNRRATELPRVVMHAQTDGIEFEQMEDGKPKHETADGQLQLQQHYATHGADVYVEAKKVAQIIFQAGKNEKEWWYVEFGNSPRGVVGEVTGRPVLIGEKDEGEIIVRPDFVPELLAITEIEPANGEVVVMRVDDLQGTNDLLIERVGEDGGARLEREIVVDRRSGEVRRVSLFGADGEMMVVATMDHYEPVTYSGGGKPTEGEAPSMPRHIVIDYPSKQARVGLTLERAEVPVRIKGTPFETPEWGDLGIVPKRAE